jgi:hypothetical protein
MPSLESTNRQAANLYWLAFLLTGDREESAEVAASTIFLIGERVSTLKYHYSGRYFTYLIE